MNEQWVIEKLAGISPSPGGDAIHYDEASTDKTFRLGIDGTGIYVLITTEDEEEEEEE